MRIVAAGVHPARVLRAKRAALRLLDRQGVHVRAQRHRLARRAPGDLADDPGALNAEGNAHLIEQMADQRLCLELPESFLRNAVQRPPHLGHPVRTGERPIVNLANFHKNAPRKSFASGRAGPQRPPERRIGSCWANFPPIFAAPRHQVKHSPRSAALSWESPSPAAPSRNLQAVPDQDFAAPDRVEPAPFRRFQTPFTLLA